MDTPEQTWLVQRRWCRLASPALPVHTTLTPRMTPGTSRGGPWKEEGRQNGQGPEAQREDTASRHCRSHSPNSPGAEGNPCVALETRKVWSSNVSSHLKKWEKEEQNQLKAWRRKEIIKERGKTINKIENREAIKKATETKAGYLKRSIKLNNFYQNWGIKQEKWHISYMRNKWDITTDPADVQRIRMEYEEQLYRQIFVIIAGPLSQNRRQRTVLWPLTVTWAPCAHSNSTSSRITFWNFRIVGLDTCSCRWKIQ